MLCPPFQKVGVTSPRGLHPCTRLFFDGKEANDVGMIEHSHEVNLVLLDEHFNWRLSRRENLGSARITPPLKHRHTAATASATK